LVGNLLSFARQVPAERTLLDLNTVVTNAVQLRSLDLRNSGTKIDLKLESVLPGVRGDGNQLMQVFFNIVSNAVDAMESHNGGGTLTIKTMRDRANVIILFSDTGPGIKEPHRVFDPFFTTKPRGVGMGLAIVRSATFGYGPFTFLDREYLSIHLGATVHSALQGLAGRGFPLLRRTGAQYLVLCRKPLAQHRSDARPGCRFNRPSIASALGRSLESQCYRVRELDRGRRVASLPDRHVKT
jgi:hypothetical protein